MKRSTDQTDKRITGGKLFHWLLIVTIMAASFVPAHYHMSHEADAGVHTHEHIIDLHLLADEVEAGHHDVDTPSFSAIPDNAINKPLSSQSLLPYAIVMVVLLVLAITQYHFQYRQPIERFRLMRFTPHLTPLLRAPPHA